MRKFKHATFHGICKVIQLDNLQIRDLNVQNALFPTDIQDYLQYKYPSSDWHTCQNLFKFFFFFIDRNIL